jgi:transposase
VLPGVAEVVFIGEAIMSRVRLSWTLISHRCPRRTSVGRKPFRTTDEKVAVVLSVLRGDMSQVEAGRRLELSQTTISKWLKQFTEAGREGLDRGDNPRKPVSKKESDLENQVQDLTTALGEAYVELRTWRKGGVPYHPSRT